MKFPGGRLLHGWDLAHQPLSLDDLLRSCRQVGLTGFAEIHLAAGAGMILYYKGSEVSAVFRGDEAGHHGQNALERLRAAMSDEGRIAVYELPMDMAHLLRGITNRRRLPAPAIGSPADLEKLVDKLRQDEHTGLLEVQTDSGSAAILLVNGRLSNMYWEGIDGKTLEKQAALVGLQQGLMGDAALVFLSDYSRDVWKARHEVPDHAPERLEGAERALNAATVLGTESQLRADLLRAVDEQLPSMVQALVCDLMTGSVLTRRIRGTSAMSSMQLVDRLPGLAMQLRGAHVSDGNDVEIVEIEGVKTSSVVVFLADRHEAVAVIADNRQPTSQVAIVVRRLARDYLAQARRITRT